jgi:hypothetical protein
VTTAHMIRTALAMADSNSVCRLRLELGSTFTSCTPPSCTNLRTSSLEIAVGKGSSLRLQCWEDINHSSVCAHTRRGAYSPGCVEGALSEVRMQNRP